MKSNKEVVSKYLKDFKLVIDVQLVIGENQSKYYAEYIK